MQCVGEMEMESRGCRRVPTFVLRQGIAVSVVQPGLIDTNMPRTVQQNLTQWRAMFPEATPGQLDLYAPMMDAYQAQFTDAVNALAASTTITTNSLM